MNYTWFDGKREYRFDALFLGVSNSDSDVSHSSTQPALSLPTLAPLAAYCKTHYPVNGVSNSTVKVIPGQMTGGIAGPAVPFAVPFTLTTEKMMPLNTEKAVPPLPEAGKEPEKEQETMSMGTGSVKDRIAAYSR